MKKRIFAVVLSAALCLSALSACGGTDKPQSEDMGGDLLAAIQAKGEIVVATEGT